MFSGGAQYQFMTFYDILLVPFDAFEFVCGLKPILSVIIKC